MHNLQNISANKRQLRFRGDVSATTNRIEELQGDEIPKTPKAKQPSPQDDVGVPVAAPNASQQRLQSGKLLRVHFKLKNINLSEFKQLYQQPAPKPTHFTISLKWK